LGDALDLPFAGRSFDLVVLVTSLEFVADRALALDEASRVARSGLLLGVLNRWSLTALRYRLSGRGLWRSARFLSPPQWRRLVLSSLKERVQALQWRTTLWPLPGAMSTVIVGEQNIVFATLNEVFRRGASYGDLVMHAALSYACPLPCTEETESD
jgi:SAM-dependent methyltransferase